MRAVETTFSINPLPPRGMIRSMQSSILAMQSTLDRSVNGISWMLCAGSPSFSPPDCNAAAKARFESIASEPPRRIVAFPVLKQRDAASEVTLGRDSKMIPITPIGTRTFSMRIPTGRENSSSNSPTGSGNSATSRTALAIPARRSGFSRSRSIIALVNPFTSARSRSFTFASRMVASCDISESAMATKIRFFCAVVSLISS